MATKTTNTQGVITAKTSSKTVNKKDDGIKSLIKKYENEIARALPAVMTPERFTRITLTALTQNPKLAECTPQSFIAAMLNAAQLGLEPNTPLGQAYLIPYGKDCQFQVGYKGLIDLAYRGGAVKKIEAYTVYENDEFGFEYGLEPKILHKPTLKEKGNAIAYYAVYMLENGEKSFVVMSKCDVEEFAKNKSKTYYKGPWQTDFDEMAKKTVVKKLLKYAPIKTELAKVMSVDETSQNISVDNGEINFVPNDVIDEVTEENATSNDEVTEESTTSNAGVIQGQESLI